MKPPTFTLHSNLAILGMVAFSLPIQAQNEAEEAIFELSAFEVSAQQDRGYYSTNSVTATRIGVPVAEIPLNPSSAVSRYYLP